MPSSYRPRPGVSPVRDLAARQFRQFPEVHGFDDPPGETGGEGTDEDEGAGGTDRDERPEWRRRLADRTPPAVRSARLRVGPRAAVGVVLVALLVAGALSLLVWRTWPRPAAPRAEPVPARSVSAVTSASAALTPPPAPTSPPAPTAPPAQVVVHVAGRVASAGVVTLAAGSRVADALTAAGGPAPGADLDAVNLAQVLLDGQQVLVPEPGQAVAPQPVPGAGAGAAVGPVDLNTASAADLDALPGVGEVLAGRIVAWREENGPFTSVDDLGEVQGIGPKVLEDLRDRVRV